MNLTSIEPGSVLATDELVRPRPHRDCTYLVGESLVALPLALQVAELGKPVELFGGLTAQSCNVPATAWVNPVDHDVVAAVGERHRLDAGGGQPVGVETRSVRRRVLQRTRNRQPLQVLAWCRRTPEQHAFTFGRIGDIGRANQWTGRAGESVAAARHE